MKAPDRIWMRPHGSHGGYAKGKKTHWLHVLEPGEGDELYIRKGAFPVEEIQELVNYPERMIDYGSWTTSMQACLERILSLLEGEK